MGEVDKSVPTLEQLRAEWRRYDPHPPTAISETYHLCAKDLDGPIAAHKALLEAGDVLAENLPCTERSEWEGPCHNCQLKAAWRATKGGAE